MIMAIISDLRRIFSEMSLVNQPSTTFTGTLSTYALFGVVSHFICSCKTTDYVLTLNEGVLVKVAVSS